MKKPSTDFSPPASYRSHLLIRAGGELRNSNFLLYQLAYTEFYFTETFWPDFGEEALYKAILDFQCRERRYGKTSEQIESDK